jgi:hypothetical protein
MEKKIEELQKQVDELKGNKVTERETIIEKHVPVDVVKIEKEIVKEEVVKELPSGFKMPQENKNIAQALADFNSEMESVAKTSVNPFFKSKYTTLSDIIDATRPLLAKNRLSVLQSTIGDKNGNIGIKTTILHTSGEYITQDGILARPEDRSIQKIASLITYLKRYELSTLLYVSSKDEDTDGEDLMGRPDANVAHQPPQDQPTTGRIRR